jgi:zinc protease
VYKGQEPKAQTVVSFFADTGLDEMEMHRLRAATTVLEMRLTDIIREEMGGTYGVNVTSSDMQPVPGYGTVQVVFGSAPNTVDTLVAAVMKEVARLKEHGPSAEDLQKVKEIEKRTLETSVRNNGYWMGSMRTVHSLGWDVESIIRRPQRTESLTVANVHAAFNKYFPESRYTQVTLLPEK